MLPQKSTYFEGTFLLLYFHSMNIIKNSASETLPCVHCIVYIYEFLWMDLFQCCLPILMLNFPS